MNPHSNTLIAGFRQFQLVSVASRIGLLKKLAAGASPLEKLSADLHVPAHRLLRLLRGLVWIKVLDCGVNSGFTLTDLGKDLAGDTDDVCFQGMFFYQAWGHLYDYIADDKIPFEQAHGKRIFELLTDDPLLSEAFHRPFSGRTTEYSAKIAELPCFNGIRQIIDVGGGHGQLTIDVLGHRPSLRGIVFDLPGLQQEAEALIKGSSVSDRCEFQAGNMFVSMPAGGDVYMLKWILHNWEDASALRILHVAREAMGGSSRLIVIERMMPSAIKDSMPFVQPDLNMLCLNGGGERTQEEYSRLLSQSGFKVDEVTPIENNYGFAAILASRR